MSQHPLTDDQVNEYYREGYLLLPGLVPTESIDALLEDAPKSFEPGSVWKPEIFDHDNPTEKASIHRLLVDENIIDVVEQLMDAPARVYYGMLAVVPAKGGKGLPWHQDGMYAPIMGRALNSFVACCDITPDMANLWVAPRTHYFGVIPSQDAGGEHGGHRTLSKDQEPENGFCLPPLKKGDVCVFDRNTLHRSLTNETDLDRYAYAAQYCENKARHAKDEGRLDEKRMLARELAEQYKSILTPASVGA